MILVCRREHGRHDALAERVVERVVDGRRQDAEARSNLAIDGDVEQRPGTLLIGRDIGHLGKPLDPLEEERRPVAELARVGVCKGVLILGLRQTTADGDVLRRLHVERDALNAGEPGLQPPDHLVRADVALVMRFQRDEDAPVVDCGGAAARADRRSHGGDGRILQHGVDHRLLALRHRRIGDVLRRLRQAEDQPGVLLREEALGDDHVEVAGKSDGREHHHQGDEAMPQHHLEAGLVEREQAVERALGQAIEPPMRLVLVLEQARAHHRGQRQRDEGRGEDGDGDDHRELVEDAPDHAAHQQHRDEDRDQRERDRDDGEADLARPLQGGLDRRGPLLQVPHDVLDHHHGIVDDEADGDRQRHQRKVVEAVAELVEHRERADQRERHGHRRNDGRPQVAQEQEDHHHHQRHRQHQRELHVAHRCADGLGAVGDDVDIDGRRDRGLQHRQHRLDPVDGLDDVGAGLALDRENDGALVVVPTGDQIVLGPIDRLADVAHAHRRAVAIGEDQGIVLVGLQQLVVGIEGVGLARTVERALGKVDVRLADDVAGILQADAARGQRLRIELDTDRRLLLAADADQTDARDLRDLLQQDVFRVGVDHGQRQGIRGHAHHQDRRVGGIHFADGGRIRKIGRQLRRRRVDRG